ncbi:MAG: nucleoside hydrolase [Clostridiaceae bacterium]|nr:nucleoside hydrolase [Clostridiaceae bacterium]
MEKKKLILDCDPGHDDAVALMMAANNPHFDLLGVTTVRGNHTLENTTINALNVCQYLGLDELPVSSGCAIPLVRIPPKTEERVHGESGLDGPVFEKLTKRVTGARAVDFIVDQVKKFPNRVTLVVTGPMTNIGLALRYAPEIISLIPEIVFMGGSWQYGNVTPAAEFNIFADAEAADIVFRSGIPLVMMGLDVTRQALCYPEIIERMANHKNVAGKLFVDLMHFFSMAQKKVFGWAGGPLHDPTCIAYLMDPSVIETKEMYGEIDTSSGPSYGRTNCDVFLLEGKPANVKVSVKIDVDKFWDIVEECIKHYN